MMTRCLLLALIFLVLSTAAEAEIFSCTDKDGVRHVADTLMRLPAECRDQARTLSPEDRGRVNYVPPLPEKDPQPSREFQQLVNEEEQRLAQKRRQARNLIQRADSAAAAYRDAVIKRKDALRNRQYGFREQVIEADKQMQRSREQKREIQSAAEEARLDTEDRRKIRESLQEIE